MPPDPSPTVLLLLGVSGVGKTTVGLEVAERLGWDFFDADDLHPAENVAKMARGGGLTDADRDPWLRVLRALLERRLAEGAPLVLAVSALKASYRARLLADDPRVRLVWLDATAEALAERLTTRRGHFAGPDLLQSQLDTLEPPAPGTAVRVQTDGTVDDVARRVIAAVGAEGRPG